MLCAICQEQTIQDSVFADSEVWLREEAVVRCETDAILKLVVLQ